MLYQYAVKMKNYEILPNTNLGWNGHSGIEDVTKAMDLVGYQHWMKGFCIVGLALETLGIVGLLKIDD